MLITFLERMKHPILLLFYSPNIDSVRAVLECEAQLGVLNSYRRQSMTTRSRSRSNQPKSCWCSLPTDLFERLLSILPDNDRYVDPVSLQHTRDMTPLIMLCANCALKYDQIGFRYLP